jgi:hypothetical protein
MLLHIPGRAAAHRFGGFTNWFSNFGCRVAAPFFRLTQIAAFEVDFTAA